MLLAEANLFCADWDLNCSSFICIGMTDCINESPVDVIILPQLLIVLAAHQTECQTAFFPIIRMFLVCGLECVIDFDILRTHGCLAHLAYAEIFLGQTVSLYGSCANVSIPQFFFLSAPVTDVSVGAGHIPLENLSPVIDDLLHVLLKYTRIADRVVEKLVNLIWITFFNHRRQAINV